MTAFILNLTFAFIELVGGLLTNSISITSDALHDLGDSASIGIALLLENKSEKKPDGKYTYGYLRYSTVGALFTSTILVCGSLVIIYNSIVRIIHPSPVNHDGMIGLAIVGVVINGAAAIKTSHGHNVNERALSLHMLEDVLGWVTVLIGSLVIKFTGWYLIDPIMSLIITLIIIVGAFRHIKEVFEIILEKAPEGVNIDIINEEILAIPEIFDVHHIHMWTIDGNSHYITLHAVIDSTVTHDDFERVKQEIRHILVHHNFSHSTIELEFVECENRHCEPIVHTHDGHHHHHHHHH